MPIEIAKIVDLDEKIESINEKIATTNELELKKQFVKERNDLKAKRLQLIVDMKHKENARCS